MGNLIIGYQPSEKIGEELSRICSGGFDVMNDVIDGLIMDGLEYRRVNRPDHVRTKNQGGI